MTAAAYPGQTQATTSKYRGTLYGLIGANQKIPAGAWIAIVGGFWVNVTATTGLEGRTAKCMEDVDNTGGSNGALRVKVQIVGAKNLELIANDTLAPVTATDLGEEVFWLDNATISLDDDSGARSKAGRAWGFLRYSLSAPDESQVFVEVY